MDKITESSYISEHIKLILLNFLSLGGDMY